MIHGSLSWAIVESPFGRFAVGGTDELVTAVTLPSETPGVLHDRGHSELVADAALQLDEYFSGKRQHFTIPLARIGTPFQEEVWASLAEIPFGEVRSYGWVADAVGRPKGPRAVGQALGKNPIAILRPCHRVVASNGLGGFGGGEALKASLLAFEGATY